ncbi:hypothetical protein DMN91_008325 [Ooceraea biroi]|uniref:SAP domain-containing protein n=1 Tax=Ooceraea biroi TaxID=2015173 RepID=A0A3L8DH70_OOCBI|nr:hypothetical protein DMN91_008325 [Ooceraea biroi]
MSNLSPFGGGKNPPWVRNAGQGIQNIQQQMLGQAMGGIGGQPMVQYQQQTQQVYQQSLGLQQPNITMASMATLGSNLPSGIAGQLYPQVATVSYPTPRALNTNAFQPSVAGVPQQVQQNIPSSSTKQRVFTGTVTKVHDNFGFVDEDVFFQTRFTTSTPNSNTTSNRNKVGRVRERSPRERRNDDEEIERKRRREERIREREKKEDRSPSRTRRSKSPRPRRRTRVVPRYMVQIPKIALDLPEADVLEIRRRYQNMYIPSDFFSTNFRWVDAFPPHMPFTLNKPCSFHVMHKDVDPCYENTAVLEPSDADYLFSAKVMLISMPAMEEIYKRCCGVSEDRDPDRDYVHPTRLINFLVGLRGKNETMAIGGPWSPSLDGPNPEKDPSVLIRTADDTMPEKKDPTHYSELDPKSMNVNELRQELVARSLSSKGLKSQLLARLLKAVKSEQAKEEGRQDEADENEEDVSPPSKEEDDKKFRDHDEDKRKLYERERAVLEKRYTLPDSSHIIVHPSRMAKSGKFDCTVMSLSVLLDYRPEDTKEHSFEVSLFAELFNEMLMRDFGFRIYRGLSNLPEKTKEKDEDKKKDKKDDKKDDKRKEDEKKSNGKRDKDKDGKKRKMKLYTHDPYLLLSFVYFDQTHCGYIFDKDIEELIYTLGLNLSRAQVRKLVQKVVTRDSLHYRKLTDKSKEDDLKDEKKDDKESDKGESAKAENEEDILRSLALGNKKLLPVFVGSGPPSKRARREDCVVERNDEETIPEGIVMYKGSLLDVEKLVSQLKRSEKARLDTEDRMMELQHELSIVNDKSTKQTNSIKGLSEDLKIYKDKLRNTEEKFKKVSTDCHSYLTAVKNMYHIAAKMMQGDTRKVEVVEIQDEKVGGEMNGAEAENKCKTDTRWGDNKVQVKKEPSIDADKDKKSDNKASVKKEITEVEKEKK